MHPKTRIPTTGKTAGSKPAESADDEVDNTPATAQSATDGTAEKADDAAAKAASTSTPAP
ncbi:9191_t:CDS:2 [Dentiscutata heterogama]|uniref:9191_t:CDS:1 n=1 Tax=Dentiscutata heterogama TaxID=1316150 RepID=A0ACA9KFV6_9GLOM|nr:9191_t:CDS:2 [Dentiscutata heterogama]